MGKNLFHIDERKSPEANFITSIFYFMKEFGFNPLDEEYILPDGSVIIKKGIPIPLFNKMMREMELHYRKEADQAKRSVKKR